MKKKGVLTFCLLFAVWIACFSMMATACDSSDSSSSSVTQSTSSSSSSFASESSESSESSSDSSESSSSGEVAEGYPLLYTSTMEMEGIEFAVTLELLSETDCNMIYDGEYMGYEINQVMEGSYVRVDEVTLKITITYEGEKSDVNVVLNDDGTFSFANGATSGNYQGTYKDGSIACDMSVYFFADNTFTMDYKLTFVDAKIEKSTQGTYFVTEEGVYALEVIGYDEYICMTLDSETGTLTVCEVPESIRDNQNVGKEGKSYSRDGILPMTLHIFTDGTCTLDVTVQVLFYTKTFSINGVYTVLDEDTYLLNLPDYPQYSLPVTVSGNTFDFTEQAASEKYEYHTELQSFGAEVDAELLLASDGTFELNYSLSAMEGSIRAEDTKTGTYKKDGDECVLTFDDGSETTVSLNDDGTFTLDVSALA